MLTWKKPSGALIETADNDDTVAYCTSIGWKQVKPPKATPKAKVKAAISPKEE